MLDALERPFTGTDGFRVILLPVEATIPRPPEPEPEPEPPPRGRVGREELLDDLASGTRITGVNLAAVLTFLLRGVGPRTWWEADKARRATRKAVLLWGVLLVVLAVIVWWTQR